MVVWQHPFVDVFKHVATVRMETMSRGDVEQLMDKHIRKNVYRLRGKIAASNYLRIPKDIHALPNMHLTGRFVYMELRRMQSSESVTFHFEVTTRKKTVLRFTFSTMYSNVRSMGINLRLPLTLTEKWTVLALDMFQLLDLHTSASYHREGYEALKAMLLCSSMYVRGADMILKTAGIHRTSPPKSYVKAKYEPTGVYTPQKYGQHAGFHAANPVAFPSPALSLRRVIGYSVERRRALAWASTSSTFFYSCESTVIVGRRPPPSGQSETTSSPFVDQEFLLGHTDDVTALAYSSAAGLLASAQGGVSPSIRFWLLSPKGHCIASVKAHAHGVDTIAFCPHGTQLCGVGHDSKRRTQILVWDVTTPSQPVCVAKQLTDYAIANIKFSPHEPDRLVSCGRESIRFWRVKNGHLPGCAVVLHEYARDTLFTDLDFDPVVMGNQPSRPLYVASSHGTVLVVDYDSMALTCVYKLHDGPIHCLRVNEGFCVTGAADGYLRVWPLDFSDFYLEASHEAPVASVDLSVDGLHALIGCVNGTIGMLEISTQQYTTVVRAHTGAITALALSPRSDSFVTTSTDGTIRVWDVTTGTQTYEFQDDDRAATAIAYHPRRDVVAVGFASGTLRLFDIPTMQIHETYQQHRGAVASVVYGRSACYSSGGDDRQLCCYQAHATTVHMVNCAFPDGQGHLALDTTLKLVAVVGKDALAIELRDMYTLRIVRSVRGKHAPPLTLLGFVQSQVVALEAPSQRVVFFCATSGATLHTFPALCSGGPMGDVAFTSSGCYAFTGRVDQPQLHVVMLETSTQLRAVQLFAGQASGVTHIQLCADGRTIVSYGAGSAVYVWSFHGPPPDDREMQDKDGSPGNNPHDGVDDDDEALYDLPQPVTRENNDTCDDDDDEMPNVRGLLPTPIQPPTKEREVVHPVQAPMTCTLHHTLGWNMMEARGSSPVVVWSSATAHVVAAAGATLLVESPNDPRQKTVRHHRTDVLGLSVSPDEAMMASYDVECIGVWHFDRWEDVHVSLLWPKDTVAGLVVWSTDGSHLVGVATSAHNQSTLLLWNVQTKQLVAQSSTTIPRTAIRQAVWVLHDSDDMHDNNVLFCTNAPFQAWAFDDSKTLVPVDLLPDSSVTLLQTSPRLPHCVLVYSASDHTVSFYDLRSHMITGPVSTLHRRHSVRHLHWVHPFLIVATDTAPCVWVYELHLDTLTVSQHTSTTPDDLEIHTVRLDCPIASMSWNDRGQGIVVTASGALWYVEADAHSKQLLRRAHDGPIECVAATATHVITVSRGRMIRLWLTATLDQVAAAEVTCAGAISVDVNASGCVVGFQDGSFRVFDLTLALVYSSSAKSIDRLDQVARPISPPTTSPHRKPSTPSTAPAVRPPLDHVHFLGDSASVLLASACGLCLLFNIPTKHMQRIALPFGMPHHGSAPPNVLASQTKIDGSLLAVRSSGSSTLLVVWQSSASEKCYVHVFANGTTTQDAWELVGTKREHAASALFESPSVSSVVVYVSHGAVEGRCYVQRQVLWRANVHAVPTSMERYGARVLLCRSRDTSRTLGERGAVLPLFYLLDVASSTIHMPTPEDVEATSINEATALVVSGYKVVACRANRLSTIELGVS
ncbi:hypothetical protein DYB28_000206 [Aphanomyces astaci]|uniref:CFA20 domain-containing protein n=4 Tax=Aphanomyces astaci TaxID=112090 RepID=A0A397BA63_APHAT|nr:hypothetical protein DYB25_001586 [Aphanomyces astaci]RLO08983.1 hypothetical protein DYB28_000206 [Aphanomyces astaci]